MRDRSDRARTLHWGRHAARLGPVALAVALLLVGLPATPYGLPGAGLHAPSAPHIGLGPAIEPARPTPSYHIIHPPFLPQWVNVTGASPSAPPSAYAGNLVSDPADNESVYFGGCAAAQCPSDQTWVFAHGLWTNITNPSDAPPARDYASMDYDGNVHSVLLFGGAGVNGPLGDTWLFHGGVWTNVTFLSQGPTPREGAFLAFDPAPEENGSVLFGGCVVIGFADDSCSNSTWVWQSWSGWVPLSTSIAPPGVGFGAMAYDPASGEIVLFGGCAGFLCEGFLGSTWELYSGQWWAVYPSSSPSARADESMVYDPTIPGIFLFGGIAGSFPTLSYQNDTWSFTNGVWTLWSTPHAPAGREAFALGTDPTGGTPILLGGEGSTGSQNDTWAFEYSASVVLDASTYSGEVAEPVTFTVIIGASTAPYNATVYFGDGSLELLSGTATSFRLLHSYAQAGSYVATVNLSDGVGAPANAAASAITVVAGPIVHALAVPERADVGVPVAFHGTGSSGKAPYQYDWRFGDGSNATGANSSHTYRSPGAERVNLTATDATGAVASASLLLWIAPDPTAAIYVGPSAPGVSSERLGANVSGGTAPFNYTWRFGDGTESGLPSPVHQFPSSGSYTVELWVNDSAGESVHRSMTLSASGPSASGGGSSGGSGTPLWFWIGLVVLLVVGVVGGVLLARRSNPPRPPSSDAGRPG